MVSEADIDRCGRALVDAAPGPATVIVFGSYARGTADDDTRQAVEKALKAAIVVSGGDLRRTDDLRFLIEQAQDRVVELAEAVAGSAWLTPWAVELRYDEYLEEQLDRDRAVQAAVAAVDMADRLVSGIDVRQLPVIADGQPANHVRVLCLSRPHEAGDLP